MYQPIVIIKVGSQVRVNIWAIGHMSHVSNGKLQETTKHFADKVMCGRYVAPFLPPDQLISFLHGEPQVAEEFSNLSQIILWDRCRGIVY